MCLYPKLIRNRRYLPTKKNNYNPPACTDERKRFVPASCGVCKECREKKAKEWTIRCEWELKTLNEKAYGVTLTFADEYLDGNEDVDPNEFCQRAVRLFIKRWVKKYHKSIRYWLIPEIGQNNTERVHMHGLMWTNEPPIEINNIWKYGNTEIKTATLDAIPYALKYFLKPDKKHKNFKGKIIASKGIGKKFIYSHDAKKVQQMEESEYVKTRAGYKTAVPMYWRRKLFTEEELDEKWTRLLDKNVRYIQGEKIDISTKEGEDEYYRALEYYQKLNTELGFNQSPWDRALYKKSRKNVQKKRKFYDKKLAEFRKSLQLCKGKTKEERNQMERAWRDRIRRVLCEQGTEKDTTVFSDNHDNCDNLLIN